MFGLALIFHLLTNCEEPISTLTTKGSFPLNNIMNVRPLLDLWNVKARK